MSLLNDALRAAEQRQNRPTVTGGYTGQASAKGRGGFWLWAMLLLLVAGLFAATVYWFQVQDASGPTPVVAAATPAPEPERVSEPVAALKDVQPAPEPAPEPEPEPQVAKTPESPAPALDKKTVSGQPGKPRPVKVEEAPVASVKQVRETPESIDLRVSRELAALLRSGDTREAEQKLRELAATQPAIASREVFARQMLIQGMPGRALVWLPESVARADAGVRLLRARALHAGGDLSGAVATLEQAVPPAGQNMEYRVTLATLLQQAGRSIEAARHWSVLIAQDDSRAAWWVGLGIALETGGELAGAVRAYDQAAQLPGLSPSLADYVRDRLKTLQAG